MGVLCRRLRLTHWCSERWAGGRAGFFGGVLQPLCGQLQPAEDPGSNPEQTKEKEEYEEQMQFHRPAVPVTEGTAAGVLCLQFRFCATLVDRS